MGFNMYSTAIKPSAGSPQQEEDKYRTFAELIWHTNPQQPFNAVGK